MHKYIHRPPVGMESIILLLMVLAVAIVIDHRHLCFGDLHIQHSSLNSTRQTRARMGLRSDPFRTTTDRLKVDYIFNYKENRTFEREDNAAVACDK